MDAMASVLKGVKAESGKLNTNSFAKALEESPVGEWRALAAPDGLHAVRLESVTPPQPARYEMLRSVVPVLIRSRETVSA